MSDTTFAHVDLLDLARHAMLERGFDPDPSPDVHAQVLSITSRPPSRAPAPGVPDLRDRLWSSIDNDTSRDLDQVEAAERLADGRIRVSIAIADVDAFVPAGSPIDVHAAQQTTSVYTGVHIYPMLPEALSTGVTSLLEGQDRLAVVTEYVVDARGQIGSESVYRATIRNHAQLTYDLVGGWLEGRGAAPAKVAASSALQGQLRLQAEAAAALKAERHRHGALDIETSEARPFVIGDRVAGIREHQRNAATDLIEDFMIAANGVVARLLASRHLSSIRRIVKTPERWARIVELAAASGGRLPALPDPKELNEFLVARKAADPLHFPDLSLAVIKLMGPGEYSLERPGDPATGHFGLAVQDYTHSTAPNRRYADLVTQRLVKASLANLAPPYSDQELSAIARACTLREDAARKVEREMSKRLSAIAMRDRVGEMFDAVVTGVTPRGTFVRVIKPRLEGLLTEGTRGRDVGDALRVRLTRTDVEHGYLDFAPV